MSKIELTHIDKYYGKNHVLKDLNLTIEDGDFMTLLGPSGCGKTTTLRMISGFEYPTSGNVFIGERDVAKIPPNKRGISMVFQSYALFPHLNIWENIAYGLRVAKLPQDEIIQRTNNVVELMQLKGMEKRFPNQLSGGQQQRVALARAVVIEPSVLLFDEPLSNLDAKLRNQMRAELIKLRQRINTTFIYVTHDQTEAMTLGDRIVIMKDGVIQQIGTPQEVFNHPANLFVAGFIGSPQMNFFENCQLTKTADSYTLTVMGETVTLTAEQSAKLAAAGVESRSVTAGVRPVHIALGESGIPAEVDVSELMGSELHLHLAANGQDVVAVIPTANIDPMAYARHTAVKFGFDAKLVHLFDADSEKNLI